MSFSIPWRAAALASKKFSPVSRGQVLLRHGLATGNQQSLSSHIQPPHSAKYRLETIRDAKPFSDFLTDSFNRQHDYLRISVTERCNLRCLYCMPEEGVQLSPSAHLLTSAEIHYLSALFVDQGVTKIRLTGGEPTVRKDIVPLMQNIGSLRSKGLKELALTTNAISLHRKLDAMVEAGLTGVNISLDTLDPFQFQLLTRRQGFDAVMKSINRVQEMNKAGAAIQLKINCVVMRGLNDHQILPFIERTRDEDMEVRFIEYMPFGGNKWSENKMLPYDEMLARIRAKYPDAIRLKDAKNDTSKTWQIPGFQGRFGFITSMTHNFCGTCNRLRITSDGNLKVCLHGKAEVSLRDILRKEHNGMPLDEATFEALRQIERQRTEKSDPQVNAEGGWIGRERELLEVIRTAVKKKEAQHAGMEALGTLDNRPMILIAESNNAETLDYTDIQSHRARGNHFLAGPSALSMAGISWLSHVSVDGNTRRQIHSGTKQLTTTLACDYKPQMNTHGHFRSPTSSVNQHSKNLSTSARRKALSGTVNPQHSSADNQKSPDRPNVGPENSRLTHVKASGEAHMVDVGAKVATRRAAIAFGFVRFSRSGPFDLVAEDRNKKGDVLGVARIAGILAAKRTSDLIPLCHPIALSKVEVDMQLFAPGTKNLLCGENMHGTITVQADVECTGPTGVEMEALCAVNGAALTVYDMCKAVDRHMKIENCHVVYKTGGNSGTLVEPQWYQEGGKEYLWQRELPETV